MFMRVGFSHRSPEWGAAPRRDIYAAALEMAEWAEEVGADVLALSEHHGADDGYSPSPLVVAAAHGARTKKIPVSVGCFLVPYHDPIRVAEDVATLNNIIGDRFTGMLVGAGYAPHEFAMFGLDPSKRGQLFEENLAVINQALTGEPFEYHGNTIRVTPGAATKPRPCITIGGSSKAMARRAARLIAKGYADDFWPDVISGVYDVYREERVALGLDPLPPYPTSDMLGDVTLGLYVTHDVEKGWEEVGPYYFGDNASYHGWISAASKAPPGARTAYRDDFPESHSIAEFKATNPKYKVLTPDQCIEYVKRTGYLYLSPMCGGLPPAIAWKSLKLLQDEVLPALRDLPRDGQATMSHLPIYLTGRKGSAS